MNNIIKKLNDRIRPINEFLKAILILTIISAICFICGREADRWSQKREMRELMKMRIPLRDGLEWKWDEGKREWKVVEVDSLRELSREEEMKIRVPLKDGYEWKWDKGKRKWVVVRTGSGEIVWDSRAGEGN